MRCYLITRRSPPHVLAESPDREWAEDVAITRAGVLPVVVLSAEEARLDPDYAAAVAEWGAGDDRRWAASRVAEELTEIELDADLQRAPEGLEELTEYFRARAATSVSDSTELEDLCVGVIEQVRMLVVGLLLKEPDAGRRVARILGHELLATARGDPSMPPEST